MVFFDLNIVLAENDERTGDGVCSVLVVKPSLVHLLEWKSSLLSKLLDLLILPSRVGQVNESPHLLEDLSLLTVILQDLTRVLVLSLAFSKAKVVL